MYKKFVKEFRLRKAMTKMPSAPKVGANIQHPVGSKAWLNSAPIGTEHTWTDGKVHVKVSMNPPVWKEKGSGIQRTHPIESKKNFKNALRAQEIKARAKLKANIMNNFKEDKEMLAHAEKWLQVQSLLKRAEQAEKNFKVVTSKFKKVKAKIKSKVEENRSKLMERGSQIAAEQAKVESPKPSNKEIVAGMSAGDRVDLSRSMDVWTVGMGAKAIKEYERDAKIKDTYYSENEIKESIDNIYKHLPKLKTADGPIYRYLKVDNNKDLFKKGEKFTTDSLTSFTMREETTHFVNTSNVKLILEKNTQAKDVMIFGVKREAEALVPKGVSYQVLDTEEVDGVLQVRIKEITSSKVQDEKSEISFNQKGSEVDEYAHEPDPMDQMITEGQLSDWPSDKFAEFNENQINNVKKEDYNYNLAKVAKEVYDKFIHKAKDTTIIPEGTSGLKGLVKHEGETYFVKSQVRDETKKNHEVFDILAKNKISTTQNETTYTNIVYSAFPELTKYFPEKLQVSDNAFIQKAVDLKKFTGKDKADVEKQETNELHDYAMKNFEEVSKLSVINLLLGNEDRNRDNVGIDKHTGQVVLLDEGLTLYLGENIRFGKPTPSYLGRIRTAEHDKLEVDSKSLKQYFNNDVKTKITNELKKSNVKKEAVAVFERRWNDLHKTIDMSLDGDSFSTFYGELKFRVFKDYPQKDKKGVVRTSEFPDAPTAPIIKRD